MSPVDRVAHRDGRPRSYTATAVAGGIAWACGQVPTRADGSIPDSLASQVDQALDNLEQVLVDANASLDTLLKVTVYLADLAEFDCYDAAYRRRLAGHPLPPRTTVQVAAFEARSASRLTRSPHA